MVGLEERSDVGDPWEDQPMSNTDDVGPSPADPFEEIRESAKKIVRLNFPIAPIVPELPIAFAQAQDQADQFRAASEALKDIDFSNSPAARTAAATEQTSEAISHMASLTKDIVALTDKSLKLSESARTDAARSEKFAKRMAWVSVIIAGASLAAAVIAIVVTTQA